MNCDRKACDIDYLEERLEALLALAHEAQMGAESDAFNPATASGYVSARTILSLIDPNNDATHNGTTGVDLLDPDEGDATGALAKLNQIAAEHTYEANIVGGAVAPGSPYLLRNAARLTDGGLA